MKQTGLRLKAAWKPNRRIYRILEIREGRSFEELSNLILAAFEFDQDHLYQFSMNGKRYDPDAICHPMANGTRWADRVRLYEEGLKEKDKFLFLYDFGDEWEFEITVLKRIEADTEIASRVVKGKGELEQYPKWEEEEEFEDWEELDEESFSEKEWESPSKAAVPLEGWESLKEDIFQEEDGIHEEDVGLTVFQKEEEASVIEERLAEIPGILQSMWLRLAECKAVVVGDDEMPLLYGLREAKLLEIKETEEYLHLTVLCGKQEEQKRYRSLEQLSNRCDMEWILLSLAGIYGVVEQEELCGLYRENCLYGGCERTVVEESMEKLSRWKLWNRMVMDDGSVYFSSFCESIAREILQKRKEYPVKWYNPLDSDIKNTLLSGEWRAAFPVYGDIFRRLFWNQGWNPGDAESLLEQMRKCVAIGYTEQEYLAWLEQTFQEKQISLNKSLRKQFLKFRREFPSATLKGYTWGEYEKERKDGYHQLSLFEEKLPFQ